MTNNKEAADRIEKLIQTNVDRIAGYQKALDSVTDPHLKSVFEKNLQQSSQYVDELRPLVAQVGGDTKTDTSTASDVYRGWMDIKDAFSPDNAQSVLNWCEKGEDIAKNAYEKAVSDTDHPFSTEIMEVLTRQQAGILSMHDEIKGLRDAHKNND